MRSATPYLTLPGTCEEALGTYAGVFGGDITRLVRLSEAPIELPPGAPEHLVFDGEMRAGELVVKASDDPSMPSGSPTVSIFLPCDDISQVASLCDGLSVDGTVLFPPEGNFAMVEDRFGVRWMLAVVDDI
ncbi:MAG: VOC family protein [Actinomycetota bacterium]